MSANAAALRQETFESNPHSIDLADRIRLMDPDGSVRNTLAEIWPVLQPDFDDVIARSVDFHFGLPELAGKLTPDMRPSIAAQSNAYMKTHFTAFMSQTWAEQSAQFGDVWLKYGVPARSLLALLTCVNVALLDVLAPHYRTDPDKTSRWPSAILTAGMAQAELATTRIYVRTKQAEQKRLAEQSDIFKNDIMGVVQAINTATSVAKARASEMETLGHAMLQKSAEVAAAAGQSAGSMNEAARTSVTLASEIGRAIDTVRDSSNAVDKALIEVEGQMGSAARLESSTGQIANIVDLIRHVAQRTNLLALNATIEAARAGEAGRGFSVVAQEVKSLANQTTQATNDIAKRIAELQQAAGDTVSSYSEISKIVQVLQQSSSGLARRMDQHGSLLDVITGHVHETATSAETTSQNIEAVTESAQMVAQQLSDMRASHTDLQSQMTELRRATDGFLQKLSA